MILVMPVDGELGVLCVEAGFRLQLWLYRVYSNGVAGWARCRVIELETALSIAIGPFTRFSVSGYAEGADSIFIKANDAIIALELKSGQVRKLSANVSKSFNIPYVSFYTPDHASCNHQ
uniref:Uncharacterized protein n=1 Tax=Arundo donax TaxID=35708 RepID=A0A0A9AKT6_ARUDO